MIEMSGFKAKFWEVNQEKRLAMALYLYGNPAYFTIYNIMGSYKNYPNQPRIPAYNYFNKVMAKLCIEMEYGFALHQNLWTWNGFHLRLKL